MLLLAGALANRGHPVDLLVCRDTGAMAHEVPPNVRTIHLEPSQRWRSLLRNATSPALVWSLPWFTESAYLAPLVRYLHAERPDALLAVATYANVLAVLGRRETGHPTRLVLSQHQNLSQQVRRPNKRWKRVLAKALYGDADAIVAVSEGVKDDLARALGLPSDGIHTIYNPVVTPSIHESALAPVSHPWFSGRGAPVVLAVGRLNPRKDFATLLRAMKRVRSACDARLVILGEGDQRAHLLDLARSLDIADAVDLPGFESNPFAYMARASAFALSSKGEGLGNVLIEALACGCPVVSTDCPSGPSEILQDGTFGALVPVGDDEAMANALIETIEKPPPQAVLRQRGEAFLVETAANHYLEMLTGPDLVAPRPHDS